MIYSTTIETAKNVSAAIPDRTVLSVTKGLVYKIEVDFPPGCAGLLYCVICDGGYQVWPSSPSDTFHADCEVISFDDTYLKTIEPFEFEIYTYNLDDTYSHSLQVRIGMVSKEIFMARFLPTYTYKYFLEIMDKLTLEQEARRAEIVEHPFLWLKKE